MAELSLDVGSDGDAVVLRFAGELDMASCPQARAAVTTAFEQQPAEVVVELAELRFMDSQGVKVLLLAVRLAQAVGVRLVVRDPAPAVWHVMSLCGLPELFGSESLVLIGPTD